MGWKGRYLRRKFALILEKCLATYKLISHHHRHRHRHRHLSCIFPVISVYLPVREKEVARRWPQTKPSIISRAIVRRYYTCYYYYYYLLSVHGTLTRASTAHTWIFCSYLTNIYAAFPSYRLTMKMNPSLHLAWRNEATAHITSHR